jgi:hypothetical protein
MFYLRTRFFAFVTHMQLGSRLLFSSKRFRVLSLPLTQKARVQRNRKGIQRKFICFNTFQNHRVLIVSLVVLAHLAVNRELWRAQLF